jgi:hypothetical protein
MSLFCHGAVSVPAKGGHQGCNTGHIPQSTAKNLFWQEVRQPPSLLTLEFLYLCSII